MCVAVVVESERGPTLAELKLMDRDNPHGGGVAWALGDRVEYRKGLHAKQIFRLLKVIPRPALVHFRWATHGGRAAHLTHPFPLGAAAILSRQLAGSAKAVLIHNGVWSSYLNHLPGWANPYRDSVSDTAVAAYAAEDNEDILDYVEWSTAVGRASGDGRMDVTMRGAWKEHNGDMYSNLSWQPRQETTYTVNGTEKKLSEMNDDEWRTWLSNHRYLFGSHDGEYNVGDGHVGDRDGYRWREDGKLITAAVGSVVGCNSNYGRPVATIDVEVEDDGAVATTTVARPSAVGGWLDEYEEKRRAAHPGNKPTSVAISRPLADCSVCSSIGLHSCFCVNSER